MDLVKEHDTCYNLLRPLAPNSPRLLPFFDLALPVGAKAISFRARRFDFCILLTSGFEVFLSLLLRFATTASLSTSMGFSALASGSVAFEAARNLCQIYSVQKIDASRRLTFFFDVHLGSWCLWLLCKLE